MTTAPVPNVFEETVGPLLRSAKKNGASPESLSAAFVKAMFGAYGRRAGKDSSARIGFQNLIGQEGGVALGKEAAGLYSGRKSATDEAVRRAARLGHIIVVKDGFENMLFPKWQFSEKGGILPGIRETVKVLRQHPHFHDLLPFTFFLNPSARLGGKRPVDLLRSLDETNIRRVVNFAAESAE